MKFRIYENVKIKTCSNCGEDYAYELFTACPTCGRKNG